MINNIMMSVRVLTSEGEKYFGILTMGRVKAGDMIISTFLVDGLWYTRVFLKGTKRITEDKTANEEEARENHLKRVNEHSSS